MQPWRIIHQCYILAPCWPYRVETLPKDRHDAPMQHQRVTRRGNIDASWWQIVASVYKGCKWENTIFFYSLRFYFIQRIFHNFWNFLILTILCIVIAQCTKVVSDLMHFFSVYKGRKWSESIFPNVFLNKTIYFVIFYLMISCNYDCIWPYASFNKNMIILKH